MRIPSGHASRRSSRALRDQNLGTVLEVTRAQGASDSLRIDEPKAKAVAFVSVPLRIRLKIYPESIAQCVLRIRVVFQNLADFGTWSGRFLRESKRRRIAECLSMETHDEDSLAMLRNPGCRVDYLGKNSIVQIIERRKNDGPSPPTVMRLKVLYVLQQEDRRPLDLDYRCKTEEQGALRSVLEPMRSPETVLFRDTCDREWLARKARSENVMVWNFRRSDLSDISFRSLAKPRFISPLAVFVPLG